MLAKGGLRAIGEYGMLLSMEAECSRCHRRFSVLHKGVDVCPDCLESEFGGSGEEAGVADGSNSCPAGDACAGHPGAAVAASSSLPSPSKSKVPASALEAEFGKAEFSSIEEGDAEMSRALSHALRRQRDRAVRMSQDLGDAAAFSSAGKVRFLLGLLVFGAGAFAFMLGSGEHYKTFINELPSVSQHVLSGVIALVSALLVMTSTRKHRWLVIPMSCLMLAGGWYLPKMTYRLAESGGEAAPVPSSPVAGKSGVAIALEMESEKRARMGERVLTASDLEILDQTRKDAPGVSHIAVFMDEQEPVMRDMLRDELTRILRAGQTHAYEEGTGYLYVVSGSACDAKQISGILSRFGVLTYVSDQEGIYELSFDPQKAYLANPYSAATLTTVYDPSFVAANLYELLSPDSNRVARAAQTLADANVRLLRSDIVHTLVRALSDPWGVDDDAYTQLVRALGVYMSPGDKQGVEICMEYFRRRCSAGLPVPPQVVNLLVREEPEFMVEPVTRLWAANPVAWENALVGLGSRAEPKLLEYLEKTESISRINSLLRFLQRYGTVKAVARIEPLLRHDDAIVRHSARVAIDRIRERSGQNQ